MRLNINFIYHYEKLNSHHQNIGTPTMAVKKSELSGVPSLNAKTIERIEILLPPTSQEQTAIATILSDIDAEIAVLETKLKKSRHIKQGMVQELLTGRIRLV
ncbi:MAG: restriction endonuclease subunit S [Magnetococcales bacterium]|nr:restriction endonuclease subunit S [Magnetococcales bacterium]